MPFQLAPASTAKLCRQANSLSDRWTSRDRFNIVNFTEDLKTHSSGWGLVSSCRANGSGFEPRVLCVGSKPLLAGGACGAVFWPFHPRVGTHKQFFRAGIAK